MSQNWPYYPVFLFNYLFDQDKDININPISLLLEYYLLIKFTVSFLYKVMYYIIIIRLCLFTL